MGRKVACLDRAFATFHHPAIHRDLHWDFANAMRVFKQYQTEIADEQLRQMAIRAAEDFERRIVPMLPELRTGTIHNDANDFNIIVGGGNDLYTCNQNVVGLIDFGDMVHSYVIGDLAVAIAYAILNQEDPLSGAANIVRGYHSEYPLSENELNVLFDLVKTRLCVSLCLAAHQQSQRPDDNYLSISQQPIRNTLPSLQQIHHRFATSVFRHACNLQPVSTSGLITAWLQKNTHTFAPILGADLSTTPCIVFDLSVSSPLINGDQDENAEPELTRRLFDLMKAAGVNVGIGRFDEPRLFYLSPMFASHASAEPRVITWVLICLFKQAHLSMRRLTEVFMPLPTMLRLKTMVQ